MSRMATVEKWKTAIFYEFTTTYINIFMLNNHMLFNYQHFQQVWKKIN